MSLILKDGIYHINHAYVPVRIALAGHSSEDGTPVIAWSIMDDCLDHLWLIHAVPGEDVTYTIQNAVSGTYMDMRGSSAADGTLVIGFQKRTPGENQKWIIRPEASGSGHWKIQNKATQTFVDLLDGGSSNETKIVGWQGSWYDGPGSVEHQHWTFSPQSLSSREVHSVIRANPSSSQDFAGYKTNGTFLILSQVHFEEIWRNSGLVDRKRRSEIFDWDAFAFVYKAEVAKWCDSQFKADGFGVLCGVMFGANTEGESAYNWMIDPNNHSSIIFFEPQNNTFTAHPPINSSFGFF